MAAETLQDFMFQGYVRILWTNAGIPGNFYSFRVYRRVGTADRGLIHETTANQSTYSYNDFGAPANIPVDYDVVMVTQTNSVLTEEAPSWSTITPIDNHYWLTHPTDNSISVRLQHVTEDSFSDEIESETIPLLGRGRHVDYGTNLGVSGSLTADLRDVPGGQTARQQGIALRDLYRLRTHLLFRNPFGDLFLINMGQPEFSRVAGVGIQEMTTVTFTYEEVRN